MKCKNPLEWVVHILVILGALNWGLVGLFNFNIVSTLFGTTIIARIIYILIGVAGVLAVICLCRSCKLSGTSGSTGSGTE